MFASPPVGHRSMKKQRSLRFESLETRAMLAHPTVVAVDVASSQWAPSFVSYLQSAGLGSGGYAIPVGSANQLKTLPWNNIDQICITFSEDVTVQAADLSVSGVNKTAYAFSAFSYDPNTHTATWTLDAPIGDDKVMLDLDANGMAPVKSVSTGDVLDGAWTDCQSTFPSGNGQGGTDFQFSINVLPGDVDASNSVNVLDRNLVQQRVGKNAGDANYSAFRDIDGSGGITTLDVQAVQSLYGNLLPSGNPVGMSDDAPTTAGIPDVGIATGTADYVLSLPNFFASDETASTNLAYSIVKNTNSSNFNSFNIDSQGNLTMNFAANAYGDATLTVRATDAAGLIVDTTVSVHISAAPQIGDFAVIEGPLDYWTFSGNVTDLDDPVAGDVVTLEGFSPGTTSRRPLARTAPSWCRIRFPTESKPAQPRRDPGPARRSLECGG